MINNEPDLKPRPFMLKPRRGQFFNILDMLPSSPKDLSEDDQQFFTLIDVVYRTLCSIMYNFVPTSGHPGGSISSGRIVASLIYNTLDYDFSSPDRKDADILSYAAGHKAMGLYAMWALRNELVRAGSTSAGATNLLPDPRYQLRLEDLLGFRRNPTQDTALFRKLHAKPLDGHPTCATPFVRIATGASGVGVPASLGLAFAGLDMYRGDPPRVHIIEGEGGMTPGRVHEALAAASAAQLSNAFLHVDWNQASIDSNRVCREDGLPGDYVQWDPAELCYVHDWNVIFIPDGHDIRQIAAAQHLALSQENHQPTALVYRTRKGWKYGVEGKDSHGAGHKFCSDGYFQSLMEFENTFNVSFPRFEGAQIPERVERNYYDTLLVIRAAIESNKFLHETAVRKIAAAQGRLATRDRRERQDVPTLRALYTDEDFTETTIPKELSLPAGSSVTLRDVLGKALNVLNQKTHGAIIGSAADLLGSTSLNQINKGYPPGFFNAATNPDSRLIALGGICEDAMGAFMSGVSSFGSHIGVTSSYSAFIAALEHVAARLHGIGQQTKRALTGEPYNTWIMINAHAGAKTGEDGPTHADPQALQLLQECFPDNVMITLTPWDPQEIWPLLVAGLKRRPAILAPFVTRPSEIVVDRAALGLPPAHVAAQGVYAMRRADPGSGQHNGTIVLQGNGVGSIFVNDVLSQLDAQGFNLNVFYVSSVELFKSLSPEKQEAIFPEALTYEAMGITDFTLATLYQWIRSNNGVRRSLHSFRSGHYLGSGAGSKVLEEGGLHAQGQLDSIIQYAIDIEKRWKNTMKGRVKHADEVF